MDKNIKEYRDTDLKSFVIANMIFIMIGIGKLNPIVKPIGDTSMFDVINTLFASTLFSALVFLFVFIADSLIPASLKNRIIWLD